MADTVNFYAGADYGIEPKYGNTFGSAGQQVPLSSITTAVNAQTANQLKTVSDALNTGVSGAEVQMTFPEVEKGISNQQLEEINRLRKLTGSELTLHGPMIEPTGFNQQGGRWEETQREQAERAIWTAIERGHKVDPDGNLVVTMHSSHGLPEPRTKIMTKDGELIETGLAVVNQRTGEIGPIPKPTKDYLFKEPADVNTQLKKLNERNWTTSLSNIGIGASRGHDTIESTRQYLGSREGLGVEELKKKDISEIYKMSKDPEGQKFIKELQPAAKETAKSIINSLSYGQVMVNDAYRGLQELYNEAYESLDSEKDKEDIQKLNRFRDETAPLLKQYKDDPEKVAELGEAVTQGLQVLESIKAPQMFKPLEGFAIDKASDTFSNVAFKGYDKFGDKAPVISIENPPAGSGITRAEDLKKLIDETRRKFVEKSVSSGVSKSQAEQQAEKLIGATWDVGHINMLRKYGYTTEALKEQTKKIAPYVKNIHLSDNFGMDHAELPMGMGDVPMEEYEKIFKKFTKQSDKIKRVTEAGDWVQHFQVSPIPETFASYGSPVASGGPYWNQIMNASGGYFSGQGNVYPQINFETYGTSLTSLPVELGGQMAGRTRLGGTPSE